MVEYRFTLASEGTPRDGRVLEVAFADSYERIAEVFEDEATRALTFSTFTQESVPLSVIEDLIARAHREVPRPPLQVITE